VSTPGCATITQHLRPARHNIRLSSAHQRTGAGALDTRMPQTPPHARTTRSGPGLVTSGTMAGRGKVAMLRLLQHRIEIHPAGPHARRVLSALLAGCVALNAADWATTAAVLARAGSHEGTPLQAALLARGGLAALAGYKALVIVGGSVLTWLGFRMWPRVFIALMSVCELLLLGAVANNVFWLLWR
jgi:hypothetical protein